jgi:hypothetical protein
MFDARLRGCLLQWRCCFENWAQPFDARLRTSFDVPELQNEFNARH